MTTIAALNVRLGMDASNFSQGVNLARNEVAKVTQIMNSAIPPHIKMRRELDLLEKAFSASGQKTATYAAAVQAVKDKYEPFTKKTKEAAEAAYEANMNMLNALAAVTEAELELAEQRKRDAFDLARAAFGAGLGANTVGNDGKPFFGGTFDAPTFGGQTADGLAG